MDAVEFITEYFRMCESASSCEECPAYRCVFCTFDADKQTSESAEGVVRVVEKWSAEHPRKTRQSEFLKLFPKAETNSKGVVCICPKKVDSECHCLAWDCGTCQEKYWLQEGK